MALLESLWDDFTDPAVSATKWSPSGNYSYTGGQLVLNGGAGGARLDSTDGYTFGKAAGNNSILIAKIVPGAGTVDFEMMVSDTASSASFGFFITNGAGTNLIRRSRNTAGSLSQTSIGVYSAASMQYLRIRTAGTSVFFAYSADGAIWSEPSNMAFAFNSETTVKARFILLTTTVGRSVTIDNVGVFPIEKLTDDFNAGTLDTVKWTALNNFTTSDVNGGTYNIVSPAGQSSTLYGRLTSRTNFSVTNSAARLQIAPITAADQTVQFTLANQTTTEKFEIRKTGTGLQCWGINQSAAYLTDVTVPYDPVAMNWWRIRHTAGTLYWETSPDGSAWTVRTSAAYWPLATDRFTLEVLAGWLNTTVAHTVSVDNVNVIAAYAATVNPTGIGDPETVGGPALAQTINVNPAGIAEPETVGGPTAGVGYTTYPDQIGDPETVGSPDLALIPDVIEPQELADAETLGSAGLVFFPNILEPQELGDPETFGGVGLDFAPELAPDGIGDAETLDGPAVTGTVGTEPDPAEDPEALGDPQIGFQASTATGDTIQDLEALGGPQTVFYPGVINPDGIGHPETFGIPALSYVSVYSGAYGTGEYGAGPYQGFFISPTGVLDVTDLAPPAIYSLPPVDPNNVLPLGIIDPELAGFPAAPTPNASNYKYGQGVYGEGVYFGSPGTPTDANPKDNPDYGIGTYGYGKYYGVSAPAAPGDSLPPLTNIAGRVKPALHILGIGPWSPLIKWRGAPNYGVSPGQHPARPAMALPPATSKGFTLRLNDGGEARCDLSFPRGSAVILDEMDTDLWWRRKDPRTDRLEMIGRFNVSHLSVATSDTGVTCNAQLVDYRTILGERMVLRYLHPYQDPPATMWEKGTPIIDILAWALPYNTRLDMSAVRGDNPYNLGKTTQPFHLPPGTTIADLMDNLEAVSPNKWEWWVETPVNINLAPKLSFIVGQRGRDNGVVLFDHGTGPTPIAAWTRNGAADDYANSIYYSGGGTGVGKDAGGGVVEQIDAQVTQYGQRDVKDGNSSIGGDIKLIRQRATRKLQILADRRPSYAIRLKQGFWRGRTHIDVGDTVTLILRLGKEIIREKYRVGEIAVDIDDNGAEDVNMVLGRLPVSADPRSKRSPNARIIRYLKNYSTPPGALDVVQPDET